MAWNGSSQNRKSARYERQQKQVPFGLWLVMGIVAVIAGVAGISWIVSSLEADVERVSPGRIRRNAGRYAKSPRDAVYDAMPADAADKGRRIKRRTTRPSFDQFAHLQGEDRKMAERVQSALDADDLRSTVLAVQAALKSENAEVRQAAVEALGWFGASALPELTGCLADPDEDVRQTAQNQWELALQEVEKPSDQFNIAAAAFATISGEDALTSLGGILNNAATDLIDGEEDEAKAAQNRTVVLQALVDIIEGGQPQNVAAAKEAYNDITCNEWISIDEAERYLADPENYDPDEPSVAGEDATTEAADENPIEESDNQAPAESPQDEESVADQDDANA